MKKRPIIFNNIGVLYGIEMTFIKYDVIVIIVFYILINK